MQGYDDAGNVSWRATGRPQSISCNRAEQPTNRLTLFTHDERNRLRFTSFGDGSPQIERRYTPDGLLDQISSGQTQWNYTYNNRRILTRETLSTQGRALALQWGIDAYGNRAWMTYPTGTPLAFAPNALGQPQRLTSGQFLLASGLSYHPNGALHTYTLSNGVQHTQQQNERGLPWTWRHQLIEEDLVTQNLVDHTYTYDRAGNVVSILDGALPSQSRGMAYDGLDRLRFATGPWGNAEYRYDAVDNLRYSKVGTRELTHHYDNSNRLVGVSGTYNASLGYDLNGNVRLRDGRRFDFDLGNRLYSSEGMTFAYDGHGRRTAVTYPALNGSSSGSSRLQMYSQDGKLMYGEQRAAGAQAPHEQMLYVHLQDRLIAEFDAASGVLQYVHTDALGSPVLKTRDAANAPTVAGSRRVHEPFGHIDPSVHPSSVGYTGHFFDSELGMVYMQQRYYDPLAGRFLSVDPVTTDANNGALFNRYMYAANNSYSFVDPDGRCTGSRITNSDGTCKSTGGFTTGTDGMAQGMQRERIQSAQSQTSSGNGLRIGAITSPSQSASDSFGLSKVSQKDDFDTYVPDKQLLPSARTVLQQRVLLPDGRLIVYLPRDYMAEPARNGQGIVFRQPGTLGNENIIRIGNPNQYTPFVYIRYYNSFGQPISPYSGRPGSSDQTHYRFDGATLSPR